MTETNPEKRQIQLQIDPSWKQQVETDRLRRAAVATLQAANAPDDAGLTIVIVGDDEMSRMHQMFRDEPGPTDVLSFPFEQSALASEENEATSYLGDIVICYPQAKRQATSEGHPTQDELDLLAVHGVLHLLGYDDEEEEARVRMWAKQADILSRLGLDHVAPR